MISKKPLATHPDGTFPDPLGSNTQGYLQHAPFSFRTVTGTTGALAYVVSQFIPGGGIALPWVNPDTGKRVVRVIIHCLPGLYGPYLSGSYDPSADIDPASGHRFNGELFPIELPEGVCVQGTSALDTIFDARHMQTAVFIFPGGGPGVVSHTTTFIDGITIRGARGGGAPLEGGLPNRKGAGIHMGREGSPSPVITNCVIVDNSVGIAINADEDTDARPAPWIVSNTIAFNKIGIWNGNHKSPAQANVGKGEPILLDNILDTGGHLFAAFQGVHPFDLQVATAVPRPGMTPPIPGGVDFNAWPTTTANLLVSGAPDLSNYPQVPALRAPAATPYVAPRVDLLAYIATATKPRGILYVREALSAALGVDLSPHDLRLAPHSTTDATTVSASAPITAVNPLIDMGIDLTSYVQIVLANNRQVSVEPGSIGISGEPFVVYHGWDSDTEGFGNPRIRAYVYPIPIPPPPPVTRYGHIDVGADEVGELVIAGYVPSTRMFATQPTNAQFPVPVQTSVYFFGLRNFGVLPRPVYNAPFDQLWDWWNHTRLQSSAGGCLDCMPVLTSAGVHDSNYTDTQLPVFSERAFWVHRGGGGAFPPLVPNWLSGGPFASFDRIEPVMRNLQCDFSPHLVKDSHPFWGPVWFDQMGNEGVPPVVHPDVYASNPWYGNPAIPVIGGLGMNTRHASFGVRDFANDNWYLYSNPFHPNLLYASAVVDGHLNPPRTMRITTGTMPVSGALPFFLTESSSPFKLFPIGISSCNTNDTYTIGPWGFGGTGTGCPDSVPLVPGFSKKGVRYNCQVEGTQPATGLSNLQTFLAVIEDSAGSGPGVEAGSYPGPRGRLELLSQPMTRHRLDEISRQMGPHR